MYGGVIRGQGGGVMHVYINDVRVHAPPQPLVHSCVCALVEAIDVLRTWPPTKGPHLHIRPSVRSPPGKGGGHRTATAPICTRRDAGRQLTDGNWQHHMNHRPSLRPPAGGALAGPTHPPTPHQPQRNDVGTGKIKCTTQCQHALPVLHERSKSAGIGYGRRQRHAAHEAHTRKLTDNATLCPLQK